MNYLFERGMLQAAFLAVLTASCLPASNPPTAPRARPTAGRLGPTSTASVTVTAAPASTATATLAPIPSPGPQEPARGPSEAAATLLVYSDFDCDLCAQVASTVAQVQADHARELRYVFRPYPLLAVHDKSAQATAALFAAREQGGFWSIHDLLFEGRDQWADLSVGQFRTWLLARADEQGLDSSSLAHEMTRAATLEAVESAYRQALASGVPGVPFLLLNGRPHLLTQDRTHVEAAVRLALLQERKFSSAPDVELEPNRVYVAHLEFNIGEVTVQLYPEAAPQAVSSFLFLAEQGWYDGTILHHVIPGQIVEGGDPTATGLADAGYHFANETDPDLSFDRPGMVGLASDGPGTNSARFFITLRPRPDLDGSQTIIGRVTRGLEHLEDLEPREPIDDLLKPAEALLERVEIEGR